VDFSGGVVARVVSNVRGEPVTSVVRHGVHYPVPF
jgi:hypothetical protein